MKLTGFALEEYKLIKLCRLSPSIQKDAFVFPPQIKMLIRSTSFMLLDICLFCGVCIDHLAIPSRIKLHYASFKWTGETYVTISIMWMGLSCHVNLFMPRSNLFTTYEYSYKLSMCGSLYHFILLGILCQFKIWK